MNQLKREGHLQNAIALDAHQYEFNISEPPALLEPGDLLKVSGKLKNISGRDWDIFIDDKETIKIGVQVYEENKPGRLEFRISLGVDKFVDGATIEFECVIDTKPLQQGKIRLVFDLVAEDRYWFEEKGAKPETITVQVLPETAGNLIKVGNQLKREGKLIEAIANYRLAIELNPNFSWLYHNLAEALAKQGNLDKAIVAYKRAIEINPKLLLSYNGLTKILRKQGKFSEARNYFKKALEVNPKINNFISKIPVICTIATRNYLAQVRCLTQSFIEHHPDGRVFALLLGVTEGDIDPALDKFTPVYVKDLALKEYESMQKKYSERDFAIALKPFILQYIFKNYDYDKVCWFDSDIYIYNSLNNSVWDKLDEYPIMLTPHLLQPLNKYDLNKELCIAVAGIYNSGFIGLSKHKDSEQFLDWWKTRLEDYCYSNPAGGLTRDQRWLDFLPTFDLELHISRDPGLNVGHWDLHNRFIEIDKGGYNVNGVPLKFFHFSGYSPDEPDVISKHQPGLFLKDRSDLQPIFDLYRKKILYFINKEKYAR